MKKYNSLNKIFVIKNINGKDTLKYPKKFIKDNFLYNNNNKLSSDLYMNKILELLINKHNENTMTL